MEKKENINAKYCTEELGKILYEDKLTAIAKYEAVANLMKRYSRNFSYDEKIENDLEKEVEKGTILEIIPIDDLGYDKEYLELLERIKTEENLDYRLCNGVTEKGYLEFNNNYTISKDLKTLYGITITKKDIINRILAKVNKPEKILTYVEANYINSLEFKPNEKVLLIGSDLGYVGFKHPDKTIYIYEEDEKLKDFLKENIYNNLGITCNYINKKDISGYNFDKIIINPSLDNDMQLKLFYELELYNFKNVYTPKLSLIISKFKLDLQDLIMTDKEQLTDSLIEGLKEMKGIGQLILNVQLDFAEKAERYLEDNKIFFDSYKKYQKFINNDDVVYLILKEKVEV